MRVKRRADIASSDTHVEQPRAREGRVVNGVFFTVKEYEILNNYRPSGVSNPATKEEIRALFEL
jgi:hypothetical protein